MEYLIKNLLFIFFNACAVTSIGYIILKDKAYVAGVQDTKDMFDL